MDRHQAQNTIKRTFEQPFEKDRFANFVKNLLNKPEYAYVPYRGNYVPDAYKPYISSLERFYKYSVEEHKIDVLAVHLKKETSLERARTMQRNFIAWYLNGSRGGELKDAALVAFVSPLEADWRFSLVKMEYRFEEGENGRVKVKEEFTPARRWSFLVGSNEASHTAQSRLVPILADDEHNPTLQQLEDAFDIETVSREFFLKYRELFIRTKEALDDVVSQASSLRKDFDAKGVDTVNFAKKLLGQIVFLYFLQKKGWFGVERDAEWSTGSKHFLRELFDGKHGPHKNFFNDILEPLFYEALRIDRRHDDNYYSRFNCKIPFLNGGLFDPIGNYDWVHTDINLPNELFSNTVKTKEGDTGNGILDIFDRYNFTVREDEPLEKDVAIDPELLGKAYEKFNAIRPDNFDEYKAALKSGQKGAENKFNKKFGVYYTPRELVHYMCQQSLINYLHTVTQASSPKEPGPNDHGQAARLILEDLETLIKFGENVGENEAAVRAKGRETRDYSYKLPESIRRNAEQIDRALANITVCDPAIGSGAFPVGMMHEIVKTRNLLSNFNQPSSVTQASQPEEEQPESHRQDACDIDNESHRQDACDTYNFKRECIERSLYGVDIDPGAVEIAKLRLWLSLVVDEEDIRQIKPLPNLDYKIVCGNSLLGVEKNLFNNELFAELERLKPLYFDETNPTKKRECQKQIGDLINQLTNGRTEFDFEVYFSEIFHEKASPERSRRGGFDVVIGNPPYVRQEQIREYKPRFKDAFQCYTGVADIYVYFYERGLRLLKKGGVLALITSNKYMRAGYGEKLRYFLSRNARILKLIDFGDAPVFEATSYPSIIMLQKAQPQNGDVQAISWERKTPLAEFERKVRTDSFVIAQRDLTPDGWRIQSPAALRLFEKLRNLGVPLGKYVGGQFYYGIKTGLNKAFVVDRGTRNRLITEHPSSAEILKPFLRGRDVKRWCVEPGDLWLIFTRRGINIKNYPAIQEHLSKFKKRLTPGIPGGRKPGSYQWYEIQDNIAYWQEFEQPKIVVPAIEQNVQYAIDFESFYSNDKTSICVTENVKTIAGLINSKLLWWFIRQIAAVRQNAFYEFKPMYVSRIPIATGPLTHEVAMRVEQILKTKEKKSKADVSELEQEIDEIVFQLYGLTEEEIQIVEDER